jgi:SAM-dependent methyltransferase
MTEEYNQQTAFHYAAYRPPLHALILKEIMSQGEVFEHGLDIGCGTGYSAIALATYCQNVSGIDRSEAMLRKAMPHAKISYLFGSGEAIPLPNQSVDVLTFAGSFFYLETDLVIKELQRVCRPEAAIICYDFEVLLDTTLEECGVSIPKSDSDYDHEANFSRHQEFVTLSADRKRIELPVNPSELAHIILSLPKRYEAFVEKYTLADPYPRLLAELGERKKSHSLQVNTFFSRFRLAEK